MNVAAILMEILANAGVRYLFGNPGTTELTFLDALPDSRLEYIVSLQEAAAVSAADGYAQASGTVGIANVHVAPGVANALSALQNAARAKSPLVLTAGQQEHSLQNGIGVATELDQKRQSYAPLCIELKRLNPVEI